LRERLKKHPLDKIFLEYKISNEEIYGLKELESRKNEREDNGIRKGIKKIKVRSNQEVSS